MPAHHAVPVRPAPTPMPENNPLEYISQSTALLIFVSVWMLWGLWIYLGCVSRGERVGFFSMIFFGPAAWVTAIWFMTHKRPARKKMVQQPGMDDARELEELRVCALY